MEEESIQFLLLLFGMRNYNKKGRVYLPFCFNHLIADEKYLLEILLYQPTKNVY